MGLLRIDRFAKGLVFALLAALAAVAGVMVLGPVFGPGPSIAAVFGGLALAWIFAIAPRPAAGFKACLVVGPMVAFGLLVWPDPGLTAVALTAMIGISRGLFLRPGAPPRTVLVEGLVAVGSLGLASTFVPGGLTGLALAVWAYFLVQSLPLLTAAKASEAVAGEADAFASAMNRAERILGR